MNRAERRKAEREASKRKKGNATASVDDSVLRHVFAADGLEALTEELIRELVAKGWPELDLRAAAEEGALYCRPRHSLIFPPMFDPA